MNGSPEADGAASLSGVILETARGLCFIPAENALVALDNPRLSPLPGTQLELLWFEGHVVPAASWTLLSDAPAKEPPARVRRQGIGRKNGPDGSALVCELSGQRLALTSVELVASGRFDLAPVGAGDTASGLRVRYRDEDVEAADLAALFAMAVALAEGSAAASPREVTREETRDDTRNPGDSDPSEPPVDDTK